MPNQARVDTAAAPLLRLEGGGKRRAQADSAFELEVPELTVHAGQLVAVVGESGCGKSTLLDLLALVMAPSRVARFELDLGADGGVHDLARLWHDRDEAAMAALRRDHLGYVLQTGGLLPFLSLRQNILLPRAIKGLPEATARIEELAGRVGLGGLLERRPDALSIGQRQRAAILRAIAHRPRLVLADEPTAAVDQARARAIIAEFVQLAREDGVAIVLVTHDPRLVAGVCDAAYAFAVQPPADGVTRSVCRAIPVEALG
jgi:putative ABC transport system ATP-binding protein